MEVQYLMYNVHVLLQVYTCTSACACACTCTCIWETVPVPVPLLGKFNLVLSSYLVCIKLMISMILVHVHVRACINTSIMLRKL